MPLTPEKAGSMGRVVIVSNRVMDTTQAAQAGGVAVAISEVLQSQSGLWFGWSGAVQADVDEPPTVSPIENGVAIATVPLTPQEHQGYYLGYANSVLWPVFHNRLDLAQFEA